MVPRITYGTLWWLKRASLIHPKQGDPIFVCEAHLEQRLYISHFHHSVIPLVEVSICWGVKQILCSRQGLAMMLLVAFSFLSYQTPSGKLWNSGHPQSTRWPLGRTPDTPPNDNEYCQHICPSAYRAQFLMRLKTDTNLCGNWDFKLIKQFQGTPILQHMCRYIFTSYTHYEPPERAFRSFYQHSITQ